MIRAVLFDLDGTLADTAPDLGFALNLQLERHGRQSLPLHLIRPHASAGTRGLLKLGFGLTPDDAQWLAMRDEFLALYDRHLCRDTVLFEGVPALLAGLDARGIPWGIVTNKPHRFTMPLVEALGLAGRARCVVSGDLAPRAKPFPDSLQLATAQLNIAPGDAIYVGDDERDAQAALASGMPMLVAGYGYLGAAARPETWGAIGVVDRPEDVLNFLGEPPSVR